MLSVPCDLEPKAVIFDTPGRGRMVWRHKELGSIHQSEPVETCSSRSGMVELRLR